MEFNTNALGYVIFVAAMANKFVTIATLLVQIKSVTASSLGHRSTTLSVQYFLAGFCEKRSRVYSCPKAYDFPKGRFSRGTLDVHCLQRFLQHLVRIVSSPTCGIM
jgi:hypothetical protein